MPYICHRSSLLPCWFVQHSAPKQAGTGAPVMLAYWLICCQIIVFVCVLRQLTMYGKAPVPPSPAAESVQRTGQSQRVQPHRNCDQCTFIHPSEVVCTPLTPVRTGSAWTCWHHTSCRVTITITAYKPLALTNTNTAPSQQHNAPRLSRQQPHRTPKLPITSSAKK